MRNATPTCLNEGYNPIGITQLQKDAYTCLSTSGCAIASGYYNVSCVQAMCKTQFCAVNEMIAAQTKDIFDIVPLCAVPYLNIDVSGFGIDCEYTPPPPTTTAATGTTQTSQTTSQTTGQTTSQTIGQTGQTSQTTSQTSQTTSQTSNGQTTNALASSPSPSTSVDVMYCVASTLFAFALAL
eukprot:Phypoly_transcript_15666.p1 GENE.Phypoly_transcript_15666~~Phypoly_transcript_15666.p1  ORF type:complete len:182 (+),score=18.80 Phypoly_transcript_15666:321-866(+)